MNTLADAAFGIDPARWPLPAAHTPEQHWHRAVAAGGQGRYACAQSELAMVGGTGPVASLAASTTASFLRQLGWHDRARGWDGWALGLAVDDEARADALIGLAADALGVGRVALSARLLDLARAAVDAAGVPRLPIRLAWVSAELAMVTGRGADAVAHAERAVALAARGPSVRHAVKSDVVRAAAACCAGDVDGARASADRALRAAQQWDLVPLTWALACLLADVGSAEHAPDHVIAIRDAAATCVRHRGGVWSNR